MGRPPNIFACASTMRCRSEHSRPASGTVSPHTTTSCGTPAAVKVRGVCGPTSKGLSTSSS